MHEGRLELPILSARVSKTLMYSNSNTHAYFGGGRICPAVSYLVLKTCFLVGLLSSNFPVGRILITPPFLTSKFITLASILFTHQLNLNNVD